MYKDLKFSVIDVEYRTLLTFKCHVMGFSELIFNKARDDVGFTDVLWTEYNIRISFVNILCLLEFV